jgi:hypothetical protein
MISFGGWKKTLFWRDITRKLNEIFGQNLWVNSEAVKDDYGESIFYNLR